jgi:hypothetical protein
MSPHRACLSAMPQNLRSHALWHCIIVRAFTLSPMGYRSRPFSALLRTRSHDPLFDPSRSHLGKLLISLGTRILSPDGVPGPHALAPFAPLLPPLCTPIKTFGTRANPPLRGGPSRMARCIECRGEDPFSNFCRRVQAEGEDKLRSMSGAPCGELPPVCRGNLLTNRKSQPRTVISTHWASPESDRRRQRCKVHHSGRKGRV